MEISRKSKIKCNKGSLREIILFPLKIGLFTTVNVVLKYFSSCPVLSWVEKMATCVFSTYYQFETCTSKRERVP